MCLLYPPIHEKTAPVYSFERLDALWERYPQYRKRTTFATMEELLPEHASWQKDFENLQKKRLCEENKVRLIEWPYSLEPTGQNIKKMLSSR